MSDDAAMYMPFLLHGCYLCYWIDLHLISLDFVIDFACDQLVMWQCGVGIGGSGGLSG